MLHQLKLFLLKAIDLTALGFLEPYVRLAYGEEPQKQLRKIGQFTVIPVLVILAAIAVWAGLISPNVKTKSGELPSPAVVANSATSLHTFAMREGDKEAAYVVTGERRSQWLAEVEAELETVAVEVEAANAAVLEAREAEAASKEARIAPLQAKVDAITTELKEGKAERSEELKAMAADLPLGDNPQRAAFLGEFAGLEAWAEARDAEADELKDQIKRIRDEKDSAVLAALARQTAVAEKEQYLKKMADQLGEDNREARVADRQEKLDAAKAKFFETEGAAAYAAAPAG